MKKLNRIKSFAELQNLRRDAKHELEISRLEFENSKLRVMQEFDTKRILPEISGLLVEQIQKSLLGHVLKLFRK